MTLFGTGIRDAFLRLKSLLDGRHTLSEISELSGVNASSVESVVNSLGEVGLFQVRQPIQSILKNDFITLLESSALMWRRQIDLHPLFGGLSEKKYRQEVFLGYMIESYHYVRLLPKTLQGLLHTIPDPALKSIVENYVDEELNHYISYEPSLTNVPRVGRWIKNSHPAPGTLALISLFESVGRKSALSLVCCLQLIEARASEVSDAESHLRSIATEYNLEYLVEPYIHHMKADVELGHSGVLKEALVHVDEVSMGSANVAVNDMHDIKHGFDLFHDSIITYYK